MELAKEQEVTDLQGKTWRLGRFRVRMIHAFRDWVAEQVGDPFAPVYRLLESLQGKLPPEALERIFAAEHKKAVEVQKQLQQPSMMCPLLREYHKTEPGQAQFYLLLLQEHHPAATLDDAFDIILAVGQKAKDEMAEALRSRLKANGSLSEAEQERAMEEAVAEAFDRITKKAMGELPNPAAPACPESGAGAPTASG